MIILSPARATELGEDVDKPFVAWGNLIPSAIAIVSSRGVLTDGALANAYSGTTFDYWLPDMTGQTTVTYRASFAAPVQVTFAGIVGHNIGTLGGNVTLQRSTDGGTTWLATGGGAHTPTSDEPIGFRTSEAAAQMAADWRIFIQGLPAGAPLYIAGLFFGTEAVFPVGIYDGFAPPINPTEVALQSNVSIGGNLLGSSVITQGTTLSATFSYLPPNFVRSDLDGFIRDFNAGLPFWFAWRPYTFTSDLRYCWSNGSPAVPSNSGGLDFMALQLSMRAFEG